MRNALAEMVVEASDQYPAASRNIQYSAFKQGGTDIHI